MAPLKQSPSRASETIDNSDLGLKQGNRNTSPKDWMWTSLSSMSWTAHALDNNASVSNATSTYVDMAALQTDLLLLRIFSSWRVWLIFMGNLFGTLTPQCKANKKIIWSKSVDSPLSWSKFGHLAVFCLYVWLTCGGLGLLADSDFYPLSHIHLPFVWLCCIGVTEHNWESSQKDCSWKQRGPLGSTESRFANRTIWGHPHQVPH